MKVFGYPFIARLIYQYANIPISLMLLIYLIYSLNALVHSWMFIFPVLINLGLLYLINRFYFSIYKRFPYKIQIEDTGIICSEFPFSNKVVQMEYENIDDITGGIFSGKYEKPINLHDSQNKNIISFSIHLKGYNDLLTIILSNIRKDVYQQALKKFKHVEEMLNFKQQR